MILAPTTMLTQQGVRIKTDMRDAYMIAQCLSYGGYHAVYIPTEDDDSVKEYLRMRNDHKLALKKIKQQINAFCIRHGFFYDGTKWTQTHLKWLKKLEITNELYRETLDEYMASYEEHFSNAVRKTNVTGVKKNFLKLTLDKSHFITGGGMNAAITIYRQMENGKQLRFFLFPFVEPCAIINIEHMFYTN